MNHRFLKTTAALGVIALGLVLAAAPAQASNMGFKLERQLTWRDGYFNYYFYSFPFFRSFPDWEPNGQMDSNDVLIDLWQKSHPAGTDLLTLGTMTLVGFDNEPGGEFPTDNLFYGAQIFPLDSTNYLIVGNVPLPFPVDEVNTPGWRGYKIELGGDPANAPSHPTVVVGSHNPALTQATMNIVQGYFNFHLVSIPYHTTWNNADEVLCAAWLDSFGGTDCATQTPSDPAASIAITSFDNDPGNPINLENAYYGRQIFWTGASTLIVGNVPGFAITPGEAYQFELGAATLADIKLPFPHY